MFLSDSTSSGLFFTINYFVVINHILRYENAKAVGYRFVPHRVALPSFQHLLSSQKWRVCLY